MRRFAAVWRPGSGEQQWRTGMSVDEFKSHDTDFFKKGLRLADLSIRGDSVAAVWRAGSGEQHWRTGMSVDEFKAQDTGLFNKGLRLADLEIYNWEVRGCLASRQWCAALAIRDVGGSARERRQYAVREGYAAA